MSVYRVAGLVSARKFMYTVKQRCILSNKIALKSWQRPTLHATHSCLFCGLSFVQATSLKVLSKVHTNLLLSRLSRSSLYTRITIWHHGDFKTMEPKQYRQLVCQTISPLSESSLGTRLGANQDIFSATSPLEIYSLSQSVHISQKVFQVHYLQYQTCCILVEHHLLFDHYHTTAYIVAVCKPSIMGTRLCKL